MGEHPIDIGGYFLGDDDVPLKKLFRFPDNTMLNPQMPSQCSLEVGICKSYPSQIFADDGRIGDGLSNGGDTVQLLAPDGNTIVSKMTYENAPQGISLARDDNGNYLLHNEIYEGKSISVGRLGYGDDVIERLTVPNSLVFSEILMLPEQVDANNDGVVDRHADAFVELTNTGADTLDLSGWMLGDDDIVVSQFYPFPDDVVLVPGGYVTIFGGGTPVSIPVLSCLLRVRLAMDSVAVEMLSI